MRHDLPTGTVTFLFTDVEGSTRLLHELGAERYADALAEHRHIVREACAASDGIEVDAQGDAFFFAFPTAPGALAAASAFTQALSSGPIRVRVGLHTGTPLLTEEGYVGGDVHRAARIVAAGHGGQVLVSASTAPLVETDLTDLGEHRFKDLSAPERVYQLGQGEFPSLKSLFRTNLPVPATPFLGREQELAEVLSLLSSEDTRLLTLTGPGGTGKTRLALQAVAEASDHYPDGVWWIPLASLRESELVLETAAQVVGARNGLAEHISDRRMLCLFDNFEQVVDAGAELTPLLGSCPNLDFVVTSREPLHVTGEQEYLVPPLAHEEGVGFFLARARAIKPDFVTDDAVPEICRLLDELPLALELAAARVKALSTDQILERIEQRLPLLTGGARDSPERQRTLRATIEWSHDLLMGEEQRLFARLAVFRGGCTLDAGERVAGTDLDALQSLVDKSLVRYTHERYWMLETIREYASERLEESGAAEKLRRRHAEYFLEFAEAAEPQLRRDSEEWVNRLEAEHDNLRSALDWLEVAGDSELAMRLAGAVSRFWYLHSHLSEGRRRLDTVLASDARRTPARAKALNGAAIIALSIGDAEAAPRAEEALELHRELGDPWGFAYSKMMIGNALAETGDLEAARSVLEESLQAFVELGDEHYAGLASVNLAWVVGDLGDKERERVLDDENLARARVLGNRRLEAYSIAQLATLARDEGRLREASTMLKESLRILRELGDRLGLAVDLGRLASVLALAGSAEPAARLLSSAEALTEELGASVPWWAGSGNTKTLALIRAQLDEAAFDEAWEQGRALTPDEAIALALDTEFAR